MNRKYLIIICVVLIIICIFIYFIFNNTKIETENAELSLTIQSDKIAYFLNESIYLTVTLKNIGNNTVRVNELTINYSSIFVNITDNTGSQLEWYGWGIKNPGNSLVLSPHEEVSITIDLQEHYNFENHIGPYNVTGRYCSYGDSNDNKETWVGHIYSNTISFTRNLH